MQEPQEFYPLIAATSWSVAQKHAKAANVGNQIKNNQLLQEYCQCCHNPVFKKPINLGENVKELHFLGFGVPLFYLFLQCCIIMNLLLILTDSIYIISKSAINSASKCQNYNKNQSNSISHYFVQTKHEFISNFIRKKPKNITYQQVDQSLRLECTNIFVYYAEITNQFTTYEQAIRMCSIIIHFCCLIFIKSAIIKKSQFYEERYYRQADYSVIFKELKSEIVHKKFKIKQLILQLEKKINYRFETVQIVIVPQNQFVQQKLAKREQLLKTYLQTKQTDNSILPKINKQLYQIQKELNFLSNNCRQKIQKDQIECKNIIIIFEKKSNKLKFLQYQKTIREMSQFYNLGGTDLTRIQNCPDPKQIIWNNLKYTSARKTKIIFVWLLSLCFLLLTYLVFYQLQSYKNQTIKTAFLMQYHNKEGAAQYRIKAKIIGWGTWISIILYNKLIMSMVLQYLTKLQKHDNIANQDFSFAFKYAIGMFFTSSLMKIMVEAVQNHNYYKHDFGIIQEQSMMFVFSAVFLPLIWVIHPFRLVHLFKRYWHKGSMNITQADANYLAAEQPYRIGKRYAEIIEMMWFCFLYVDLIPLGSCFIFLGQCFYYWIDKYNLLRRSSFNYTLSGSLSEKILPLLDLTLVWRFLGAFIFDLQLRQHVNPVTLIMLFVSICFVLMPWERIMQYFDHQQYQLNTERYGKVKQKFFKNKSYISENPIQNFVDLNLVLQRRTHILGS